MKLEQAARSALEALREFQLHGMTGPKSDEAIIALREALNHSADTGKMIGCAYCNNQLFAGTKCNNCGRVTLAEQAEQEPVAWMYEYQPFGSSMGWFWGCSQYIEDTKPTYDCDVRSVTPLYAAPVRTKDLTDVEVEKVWRKHGGYMVMPIDFARAVIAKFKEKNNVK